MRPLARLKVYDGLAARAGAVARRDRARRPAFPRADVARPTGRRCRCRSAAASPSVSPAATPPSTPARCIETQMSRAGWWLAQAARLIGGPLPHLARRASSERRDGHRGRRGRAASIWTRLYARRRGFPQVMHSSKRFAGPTGLEEYVGYGVGMALTVHVEDGALVFRAAHYFLQLSGAAACACRLARRPARSPSRTPSSATAGSCSSSTSSTRGSAGSSTRPPPSRRRTHDLDPALDPDRHPDRDGGVRHDLSPRADRAARVAPLAAPRADAARGAQPALRRRCSSCSASSRCMACSRSLVMAVLVVEVFITLADFIEEDMSRKLPASERVNHTLLAINYGAILVLAVPVLIALGGRAAPRSSSSTHGYWSALMAFAAVRRRHLRPARPLPRARRTAALATPPEELVDARCRRGRPCWSPARPASSAAASCRR